MGTIIVGCLGKDGIALAADSQAGSFRGVEVKRSDYMKIHLLGEEGSAVKAVIAGAGAVAFINKAVGLLREEWAHKRFTSVSELESAAEGAMMKLAKKYFFDRQRVLGGHILGGQDDSRPPRIPKRLPKHLQEEGGPIQVPDAHLLMGAIDSKGGKLLATIGPDGVAETEDTYTCVGSGSAYAEYVLAKLYAASLSAEQLLQCAIYTVEEVKKVDPACGGPVRAVTLTTAGIKQYSIDDLRELVAKLGIRDDTLGRIWRSIILGRRSPSDIEKFLGAET